MRAHNQDVNVALRSGTASRPGTKQDKTHQVLSPPGTATGAGSSAGHVQWLQVTYSVLSCCQPIHLDQPAGHLPHLLPQALGLEHRGAGAPLQGPPSDLAGLVDVDLQYDMAVGQVRDLL